ncbi:MFS transporter [Pedobacter sp. AW31-3R]|uniref:MFS transporter n=1 Tax=Pedobacter sp. AW31-3R TaxID=3445781 RepID=UPI003FA17F2B
MTYFKNKRKSPFLLLLILSSTVFLSVLDIFIVNVSLPSIQRGLLASNTDLQLIVANYLLSYAACLILGSKVGDWLGRKKVLIFSIAGFSLSSLACGLVSSSDQLIIGRTFQGICAAFMVPQGLAILQTVFTHQEARSKALGTYGSIAGIASVLGQLLGGLLPAMEISSQLFGHIEGWRLIFLINVPVGIFAAILGIKMVPESAQLKSAGFDHRGFIALSISLIGLIYPLISGREKQWPVWMICLLMISLLGFWFLTKNARYANDKKTVPFVDLKLFKERSFRYGSVLTLFYFIAQDSYFLINGVFMQSGLRLSPVSVGLLFIFQGIGYVCGSALSSGTDDEKLPRLLKIALLMMMLALCGHLYLFDNGELTVLHYLVLIIYGVGCGIVLPSLLLLSLKDISQENAGMASGVYSTIQQTAIALGVAITGGIFFYLTESLHTSAKFVLAYHNATYANIFFLFVVLLILNKLDR